MTDTIKLAGAVIGIAAALASAAGTYYVLGYRVGQLEERVSALEHDESVIASIRETQCLVARVHDLPLPGC